MNIWVVIQLVWLEHAGENLVTWEMQGVFSSVEKAVAACRTEDYGFYVEELDKELPHERIEWGAEQLIFPLREKAPE